MLHPGGAAVPTTSPFGGGSKVVRDLAGDNLLERFLRVNYGPRLEMSKAEAGRPSLVL